MISQYIFQLRSEADAQDLRNIVDILVANNATGYNNIYRKSISKRSPACHTSLAVDHYVRCVEIHSIWVDIFIRFPSNLERAFQCYIYLFIYLFEGNSRYAISKPLLIVVMPLANLY